MVVSLNQHIEVPQHWDRKADSEGSYAIAVALLQVARALDRLGHNNALTEHGAIEGLAMVMKKQLEQLTSAVAGIDTSNVSVTIEKDED